MHMAMWILAFIGVALIYLVPYIGKKLNFSNNLVASLKLAGVIVAVIALIVLAKTNGFN